MAPNMRQRLVTTVVRGEWASMEQSVVLMSRDSSELCVHSQDWDQAYTLRDLTRDMLAMVRTPLLPGSYRQVQMLSELEELI